MKVIIEQPTYLSWLGYYGMLQLADVFVFYDDVAFDRQSWQQRNRIKSPMGEMAWLTVPILRNFGQKINEVKINNNVEWRRKHWKTLEQAYGKAPYFKKYRDEVKDIYDREWEYLCELDIHIIMKFAKIFGVRLPKIFKSSEFEGLEGHKTDRLLVLLNKIGATEYYSGVGTKAYIEVDKFKKNNIKLCWYEFQHPIYSQIRGKFVSHLSAIDAIFNLGENTLQYIQQGINNSLTEDCTCLPTK